MFASVVIVGLVGATWAYRTIVSGEVSDPTPEPASVGRESPISASEEATAFDDRPSIEEIAAAHANTMYGLSVEDSNCTASAVYESPASNEAIAAWMAEANRNFETSLAIVYASVGKKGDAEYERLSDAITACSLGDLAPTESSPTTATGSTASQEEQVVEAICSDIKRVLDENPDMRVAQALSYGESLRTQLQEAGWDLSRMGQLVDQQCDNGYNNQMMLGYGGFGPLVDRVSFTLDRGTCGSTGDYGGTMAMTGTGPVYEVVLELQYIANEVVEHETSERVAVEPGGNAVAFEFFLPGLPEGGNCEVALRSVAAG